MTWFQGKDADVHLANKRKTWNRGNATKKVTVGSPPGGTSSDKAESKNKGDRKSEL